MELNLFFLAPLLQCKFIDRCALFMRAKKKIYFILPQRLNILFHSLSHSTPLYLSQSLSSHPFPRLSQSLKLSSSLSHSHLSPSLSQSPSFTTIGPTQPSQAVNRLTITLSSSLIHCRRPNPAVPSCWSPQTHAADHLRPMPPTHPFYRPSSPTLCLFVIGDFLFCL